MEDDSSSREALTRFLKREGAQVVAVPSATEALEEFQRSPPSLLISDIGLPGQDGYELMRQLRDWERENGRAPTPALALTAYAGRDDSHKARSAGYQQHLPKPVDPDQLLQAVNELLRPPAD